jgi:hypothetical protein
MAVKFAKENTKYSVSWRTIASHCVSISRRRTTGNDDLQNCLEGLPRHDTTKRVTDILDQTGTYEGRLTGREYEVRPEWVERVKAMLSHVEGVQFFDERLLPMGRDREPDDD